MLKKLICLQKKPNTCERCNKSFKNKRILGRHKTNEHSTRDKGANPELVCEHCGTNLQDEETLKIHRMNHSSQSHVN